MFDALRNVNVHAGKLRATITPFALHWPAHATAQFPHSWPHFNNNHRPGIALSGICMCSCALVIIRGREPPAARPGPSPDDLNAEIPNTAPFSKLKRVYRISDPISINYSNDRSESIKKIYFALPTFYCIDFCSGLVSAPRNL